MAKKHRRRQAFAACILLLALAALVAIGALAKQLLFGKAPSMPNNTTLQQVRAITLQNDWLTAALQSETKETATEQMQLLLQQAKQLGANTILLTGWGQGGVLFRGGEKLPVPQVETAITQKDGFFTKYDPLQQFLQAAEQAEMQVALIATDELGEPVQAADAPLAAFLQKAADRYRLCVYLQGAQGESIAEWTPLVGQAPALLQCNTTASEFAAVHQTQQGKGILLGDFATLVQNPDPAFRLLAFTTNPDTQPLLQKTLQPQLAFLSPAPNASASGSEIYLIGTSDPALPLTVNGQAVQTRSQNGVWGIALPLQEGTNHYTAVQNETTITIAVSKSSGSGGTGVARPDGSAPAQAGQKLRVNTTLASMLTNPSDNDSIVMTAYEGGIATVQESRTFTKGNQTSHAYKLQNGAYITAANCTLLPMGTPNASFDGIAVQRGGNLQTLAFSGQGTPIFAHSWQENSFSIQFFSASYTGELPQDFGFEGASVQLKQGTESFTLQFQFAPQDPLYGYHVEYTADGSMQLLLKHNPQRSGDPAQPLLGVTVLLDAGHGANDGGAFGCPDPTVPQEKDLNLALTLAAKKRLEQLGASVSLTRTDDTFFTLGERLQQLNREKPDFFIAIHHNSTVLNRDVGALSGTECYWFYTGGKPLAQALVQQVCAVTGRNNRGDLYDYFYVTRSNICPAVLLETGFVSNPLEFAACADEQVLWKTGGAIAEAVLNAMP